MNGAGRASSDDAPLIAAARGSLVERILHSIGAESKLTEAVLGDLAEERALRVVRDGRAAATIWYLRDACRSTPHLVVNALRYGGPRARARLALVFGAIALVATAAVVTVVATRKGPPASLASGYGSPDAGIVINNLGPIQLPMRVTDARGHVLPSAAVHFAPVDNPAVSVSPNGVVKCRKTTDATLRASLGSIVTNLSLHCRPVESVQTASWLDFVSGDEPRDVPFSAVSPDGALIRDLRGTMNVQNPDVARIEGTKLRPLRAGVTGVEIQIGEQTAHSMVHVYERVPDFASLTPNQHFVAIRLSLARGDTLSFGLPSGMFWLKYIPAHADEAPPTITVDGRILCTAGNGIQSHRVTDGEQAVYCYAQNANTKVIVAHGRMGALVVQGALAIDRM